MESQTKIFAFTTLDMWQQRLKYVKINSVNSLYLITNNMNGYFEEFYENKCLTPVPTNKSK